LEQLCAVAGGYGGAPGGAYFGGGPGIGVGGFGGQGLGVGVNFANGSSAGNVGFATDFNGHYGANVGFQNQNFGFNLGFNNGLQSAPCHPGFNACGGVIDFEYILLLIVAILEQMEREKIAGIVTRMGDKSKEMKGLTANSLIPGGDGRTLGQSPGYMQGMQQESAMEQAELTMAVQNRQRLLDTLNNIIRVGHEAKENAIRRMV